MPTVTERHIGVCGIFSTPVLYIIMDTVDLVGATVLICAIGVGFGYYVAKIFFGL